MDKIKPSEITKREIYIRRRDFIKSGAAALLLSIPKSVFGFHNDQNKILDLKLSKNDNLNSYEEITTYNNFYDDSGSDSVRYERQFQNGGQ